MRRSVRTRVLALLAVAVFAVPLLSQAAVYQIELIIFSHFTSEGVSQEQWPIVNPSAFSFSNSILLKTISVDGNFSLLPPSQFILNEAQSRLDKNPSYHTLMHIAWRQPVYAPRRATAVRVVGGPVGQVNGTVRVSVAHYLNVSFNLLFAAPTSQLSRLARNDYFNNAGDTVYFHLSEKRRMRSNELNYVDFPLYGVLIKIVPIKNN